MSKIEVEGMGRLQGEVRIQGSKNAALPILSACVLNRGETILHRCPKIGDVSSMLEALKGAGAKITWQEDTLILDTSVMEPEPFIEKAGKMRSSVILLGSFLARFGRAVIGYPGGCCIGKRPIDLHEQCLNAMGTIFCEEKHYLEARCGQLESCDLFLPYPSVGVTENVILAACGAAGMTRIYGAAKEPEVTELCRFLTVLGVRIYGIGTGIITVLGRKINCHAEYTICSDRIVAGTYLMAAAAAGGEIILKDAPLEQMRYPLRVLGKLGAKFYQDGTNIKFQMKSSPKPVPYLCTAPYPGFPTDLQSPLLAVLCKATGPSRIEERIFENRFLIAEELEKMGAVIRIEGQTAFVCPAFHLKAADLKAKDLRGGAALVVAALGAEGVSVIENAQIIFRGYENLEKDLCVLGAKIRVFS